MTPIQLTVKMGESFQPQNSPFSLTEFAASILQGDPTPLEWVVPPPLDPCKILASFLFLNRSIFLRQDFLQTVLFFDLASKNPNYLAHVPSEIARIYMALRRVQHNAPLDMCVSLLSDFFSGQWSPPILEHPGEGRLTLVDQGTNGFSFFRCSDHVAPFDSWYAYRTGSLRGLIYGEQGSALIFAKSKAAWDLSRVASVLGVVHQAADCPALTVTELGDLYGPTFLPPSDLLNALVRL